MTSLPPTGILPILDQTLEYRMIGPPPERAPTLVLLHEGLGCVGLWGSFPERLAAATGLGVFVYSRAGYGKSSPAPLPRPLTYMHDEALATLPLVLDAIGFRRGLLVGHSDGASIATLYAGSVQDHRIRGVSLIAPHFVVEDLSIASIAKAKTAYDDGELRTKLAAWHQNVDVAFRGWNDAWLDTGFRTWDISDALAYIRVPIQIVQGEADQYGTRRQIEIAEDTCYCPVDVVMLPGIGHAPHREAPEATLDALAAFVHRLFELHAEGMGREQAA